MIYCLTIFMKRNDSLRKIRNQNFDVFIVGGGNSGASITSCLSSQSCQTALVDRCDFSSGTSQSSSNLIWGGIKYLENYEFLLVKKLCESRNRLLTNFPNLVEEIRFYCPHEKLSKHPFWKLCLGSWFYWIWGKCFTKKPKLYSLPGLESMPIKIDGIDKILEYSDAYLPENDTRFVFDFIKQASKKGAVVCNYLELKSAVYKKDKNNQDNRDYWFLELYDHVGKKIVKAKTKVLINAAGSYVDQLNVITNVNTNHQHCYSKGVHLIVKQLFTEKKILTFFSNDQRLFFAIPMGNCTCIGTTDTWVERPEVKVKYEDIDFILSNINRIINLPKPITREDITSTRVGVRPLVIEKVNRLNKRKNSFKSESWFNISRKHIIEEDERNYFSVFGGKLTDCLNIAEETTIRVLDKLSIEKSIFSKQSKFIFTKINLRDWFNQPSKEEQERFKEVLNTFFTEYNCDRSKFLFWFKRLWRRYGVDAYNVLGEISKIKPFFKEIVTGTGFAVGEINYQIKNEMVVYREDITRRRTMLELIVRKNHLNRVAVLKKIKTRKI